MRRFRRGYRLRARVDSLNRSIFVSQVMMVAEVERLRASLGAFGLSEEGLKQLKTRVLRLYRIYRECNYHFEESFLGLLKDIQRMKPSNNDKTDKP